MNQKADKGKNNEQALKDIESLDVIYKTLLSSKIEDEKTKKIITEMTNIIKKEIETKIIENRIDANEYINVVNKTHIVEMDKDEAIRYYADKIVYDCITDCSENNRIFNVDEYTNNDFLVKNFPEIVKRIDFDERVSDLQVDFEKKDVDTSREYDEQEIVGQSVKKGEKLAKGDSIILYIPNISEVYPDMQSEGWSKDDAEAFATKYSLNITFQEEETTAYEEGKVIRQSRAAGSPIIKNANITVTIAKKPKETIIKDNNSSKDNTNKDNTNQSAGTNNQTTKPQTGQSSTGTTTKTP